MAAATELSLGTLLRSTTVVAGGLLLLVGLGDVIVGRSKIAQYQDAMGEVVPAPVRDPTQLFPTATEAEEQRAVAEAKLGYYELLFTVGQGLSALGFMLMAIGVLQVRFRTVRQRPDPLTS